MAIRAVIFDLDDTLLDWSGFNGNWWEREPYHLEQVHRYLLKNGHRLSSDVSLFISEFNRRSREGWYQARDSLVSPHVGHLLVDTAAAMGADRSRLDMIACLDAYKWESVPGTVAFPDAISMLRDLRDMGLMLGIVTNSYLPMRLRDTELRDANLLEFFPKGRWAAADAGYLKPHVKVFEIALKSLGVTADEAVFVGDNYAADVVGAKGAGIRAVWRAHDADAETMQLPTRPDAIIHTLSELPEIVARWSR
jgi:HAD superfamily hydrolase (TIGR01509 family)